MPDQTPSSHPEREQQLTALLLGELSEPEAAELRRAMGADPALQQLHDQLAETIGLVREMSGTSELTEASTGTDAPKLSGERRTALLGAFKVVRPEELARREQRRVKRRELLLVAAMLIGLLSVGAVFTLTRSLSPEMEFNMSAVAAGGGRRDEASDEDFVAATRPAPVTPQRRTWFHWAFPGEKARGKDSIPTEDGAVQAAVSTPVDPQQADVAFQSGRSETLGRSIDNWIETAGTVPVPVPPPPGSAPAVVAAGAIPQNRVQLALPGKSEDSSDPVRVVQNRADALTLWDTASAQRAAEPTATAGSTVDGSGRSAGGVRGSELGFVAGNLEGQTVANDQLSKEQLAQITQETAKEAKAGAAEAQDSFQTRLRGVIVKASGGSAPATPAPTTAPTTPMDANRGEFDLVAPGAGTRHANGRDEFGGALFGGGFGVSASGLGGRFAPEGLRGGVVEQSKAANTPAPNFADFDVASPVTTKPNSPPADQPSTDKKATLGGSRIAPEISPTTGLPPKAAEPADALVKDMSAQDGRALQRWRELDTTADKYMDAPQQAWALDFGARPNQGGAGGAANQGQAGNQTAPESRRRSGAEYAGVSRPGGLDLAVDVAGPMPSVLPTAPSSGLYSVEARGYVNRELATGKALGDNQPAERPVVSAGAGAQPAGESTSVTTGLQDANSVRGLGTKTENEFVSRAAQDGEASRREQIDQLAPAEKGPRGPTPAPAAVVPPVANTMDFYSASVTPAPALMPQKPSAATAPAPLTPVSVEDAEQQIHQLGTGVNNPRFGLGVAANFSVDAPVSAGVRLEERMANPLAIGTPARTNSFFFRDLNRNGQIPTAGEFSAVTESVGIPPTTPSFHAWHDQAETSLARNGIVDEGIVAETKPTTFWGTIANAFGNRPDPTARIQILNEPALDGMASASGFDPFWEQSPREQVQSKEVLQPVLEQLTLNRTLGERSGRGDALERENSYRKLRQMIDVDSDSTADRLNLRVKAATPEESQQIATAVAHAYREKRRKDTEVTQLAKLKKLEQEVELEKRESKVAKPEDAPPARQPAPNAPVPQPEVVTTENPFSTFSLNVSDVSFKLAAASLEKGQMPDAASVRTEEFINALDYRDPEPTGSQRLAFHWERARYPFAHNRDLVRFSVKTAASGRQPGRPLNVVLLLDNSGSMERADRLRIRRECLRVLASQLQPQDRVSVVAFARTPRLWVDGLSGAQAGELPQRVGNLSPDGGTNLEEAMNLAYQTARRHFQTNGINRVVLLTDGAANLGEVDPGALKARVEANRREGVALDCFGIGWDGYNDDLLETLSRNGDGRYGFINSMEAAANEFAGQLAGALRVAASDVKVQVQFNPSRVTAYRQMGYAKHQLKKEQFRDNTVDAAEIGAAEAGNALYVVEVNPRGEGPLGVARVRFRIPGTQEYQEQEWTLSYDGPAKAFEQGPSPLRLAGVAAAFSEWLTASPFAAEVTPSRLIGYLGTSAATSDPRVKQLEAMLRQAGSLK